jgi:hypothetical protein
MRRYAFFAILAVSVGCARGTVSTEVRALPAADAAFLDTLERYTFDWFWETTNPTNGLTPDRAPDPPFASIAAVGFALTAYPIGVERGYVTRAQAAERAVSTLRFFWRAPQGSDSTGMSGRWGFFYHFLNMNTGLRQATTELSTIDTALLLAGVLFVQQYFDAASAPEPEIRALADSLYRRTEWPRFHLNNPLVTMAWRPERGFGPARYQGYDEAMILYVLALGSPTFPGDSLAWQTFTTTYKWGTFYGQAHVNFAPLFGHQYSHVWIDFRGIRDAYMRDRESTTSRTHAEPRLPSARMRGTTRRDGVTTRQTSGGGRLATVRRTRP